MAGFNHLTMVGNLTRDPQLSYTETRTAVCDFGLAVNRKWKGANGEKREAVCYIECRSWGKSAEVVAKHLAKGALILADGHLDFEKWDQDGATRSRHRFIVESVQFLPSGK